MTTAIRNLMAREHAGDLRREAERRRAAEGSPAQTDAPAIELRLARADENRVLRRLAALDEAAELEGQVLLALIDGNPVAGLSLRDARVVANPFVRTSEAVALLRLRAQHVTRPRHSRRRIDRILAPLDALVARGP